LTKVDQIMESSDLLAMVGGMDLLAMVVVAGAVLLIASGTGHAASASLRPRSLRTEPLVTGLSAPLRTGHGRHPARLRAVLGAQRLPPPRWRGPVAAFTAAAELAVGSSAPIAAGAPLHPDPNDIRQAPNPLCRTTQA
jgi:hypothetical protein